MKLLLLGALCLTASASPNHAKHSLKSHPGSRIIGGSPARSGQFPFLAAIFSNTVDGRIFCGGTLLSELWILTAGQCVDSATMFDIHLGSTARDDSSSYAVKVSADTYELHPDYNPLTLDNDIGLIMLREPLEFSDYLRPVDYLPFGELPDSSSVMATGWGQISDEDPGYVNELRWVYVTTVSNLECKMTYGDQITDNMVCVDGNFNEGTCIGDTGSPLVQTISRGHTVVVGISSFLSSNGCESTDPSGFTRVDHYNSWIRNTTGLVQ